MKITKVFFLFLLLLGQPFPAQAWFSWFKNLFRREPALVAKQPISRAAGPAAQQRSGFFASIHRRFFPINEDGLNGEVAGLENRMGNRIGDAHGRVSEDLKDLQDEVAKAHDAVRAGNFAISSLQDEIRRRFGDSQQGNELLKREIESISRILHPENKQGDQERIALILESFKDAAKKMEEDNKRIQRLNDQMAAVNKDRVSFHKNLLEAIREQSQRDLDQHTQLRARLESVQGAVDAQEHDREKLRSVGAGLVAMEERFAAMRARQMQISEEQQKMQQKVILVDKLTAKCVGLMAKMEKKFSGNVG